MAQVNVQIGGRSYSVSCGDGGEERVIRLGQYIDRKADDLTGAIGSMSEPRLLLMASLMIADELFDLREGASSTQSPAPAAAPAPDLRGLASRIEALADTLEREPA